jgi:putative serine protease PepD
VLVGALLLGGAAGVGGAAWYDAWQGDDNSSVAASSSGPISASNAANLPSGSVEKVAATVLPSVVKINVSGNSGAGSGSGIVLDDKGHVLTNNHVVALAGQGGSITVSFNDGKTVRATVVGTDSVTDLAVIKVDGVSGLKPATIGKSSDLRVGQSVVAIGSPYGLNSTVTTGIVSALNRPVSVQSEDDSTPSNPFGFGEQQQQQPSQSTTYPAIQTDAAINPGNSGGPLVDMSGRVVGINSSIRTSDSSGLGGSGGSIGLGFAIPIDEALPIVNQIIDGDTPTHARLAISVSDVGNDTLAQGAQVESVEPGGPAADAGLRKGDVITKVGDEVIDSSESLVATIRGHRPDEKVTITYLRDGKTQTTTATLGSDAKTTNS